MSISFFLIECGRIIDHHLEPKIEYDLPLAFGDLCTFYKLADTRFNNANIDVFSTNIEYCKDRGFNYSLRSNIISSYHKFCEVSKTSKMRIIYYAGHGVVNNGELYLVPADFRPDHVKSTGISLSLLIKQLHGLSGQNIIFLDCCRQSARIPAMPTLEPFSFRMSNNVSLFLGCSDGEASHETGDVRVEGGIFTASCIEAFNKCDNNSSIDDFFNIIKKQQHELVTELVRDRNQIPNLYSFGNWAIPFGKLLEQIDYKWDLT